MEYKGIDVSQWQRDIDWAKVKATGIVFAMIRASYGQHSQDPYFKQNIENAQRAGIKCGAYHYTYATNEAAAIAECDNFLNTIKGYKLEYPVVIDMEEPSLSYLTKDQKSNIVVAFCDKLEKAGYWAMVYANENWLDSQLDYDKIKRFSIWLAEWGSSPSYTKPFGIWQNSNKGSVDGISTTVDLDISYQDYTSLIQAKGLNGFSNTTAPPDYKSLYEGLVNDVNMLVNKYPLGGKS